MDFGYNDPTTLMYIMSRDREGSQKKDLYIQQKLYRTGMTSKDIIQAMSDIGVPRDVLIVADNARPELIQDIKDA